MTVPENPHVVDVTAQNFEQEVLVRSQQIPVVVDFWAPWCEPCRQLAPLLHKLAEEYGGRFVLAKMNVDQSPEVAGMLGIQSIPTVVAFVGSRPVDHFQGLLPEQALREWLERLLPSPAQEHIAKGRSLLESDPVAAEKEFRTALQLESDAADAKIGLAEALVAQRRTDEAAEIIAELESRGFLEPEAQRIKSTLELEQQSTEAGDVAEARRAAEANPDDLSLKMRLAEALVGANKYREALDVCLEVVERDKSGVGQQAKELMLKVFEKLGPENPMTTEYRRKLATILY
ncbi:MAG: co-chaperone YbbN [Planctomycetota bacterium]|nr:MAG: co-chaperone YbbN [Planctomycetota bacterium]